MGPESQGQMWTDASRRSPLPRGDANLQAQPGFLYGGTNVGGGVPDLTSLASSLCSGNPRIPLWYLIPANSKLTSSLPQILTGRL